MSHQSDSENDIWEYKPLEKKKKRRQGSASVTRRKCTARKTSKSQENHQKASGSGDHAPNGFGEESCKPLDSAAKKSEDEAKASSSGDFCPICQMPFFILVVQSQRWHVSECLDSSRDKCTECPDGLRCSSTIPNHYKKFNHTLLAQSRANGDTPTVSLTQRAEDSSRGNRPCCLPGHSDNDSDGCVAETFQDDALNLPASSSQSISPDHCHSGTPPAKVPNGLLLLRSPGPEDLKKKKGWLSSSQSQKSVTSSQESKKELLTPPVKEERRPTWESSPKTEDLPEYDDAISYSPLSELPAESQLINAECRKALFNSGASKNQDENSVTLFSDSFSSEDDLFAELIENDIEEKKESSSPSTQLASFTSSAPTNQGAADTADRESLGKWNQISKTSVQSPQSIVLERLRDSLLSAEHQSAAPPVPSSQNSTDTQSQSMPLHKGHSKASQAPGLRQTDIGVFFGLKPLKKKEAEAGGPKETDASSSPAVGESSGRRRQRRERQRKPRADRAAAASQATDTANNSDLAEAEGEAGRGGSRGWKRKRWNGTSADGEVQPRRCPFYKKIPGTKFAIDAFRYGEIEGITGYFLTHFHSDHYGGLTKSATFPIYCNRITGNLVKSKLKVAERYVHILPMNTEVTVDGVKVVLLDANHCPGAAMLLFFLPDGQTVLHTGDFRADPSMEAYPQLLGCRVQTLYLDTTYCSPEYTFPKQQEVINFAANSAFESVTLNPRTLVVCGSYSVGKEKVFLALAEVLGSKVCLSRDKYNTMCCLESDQIRERVTTDWRAAQVHVLPMMQLTFNKLQDHLARFSQQYNQLVAFKPTGWTFSQQVDSVDDIQPQTSGNISIYGIPYSEHSSFLELRRFVQWLKPLKIIPTVNVGSWASRKAMERCFSEWLGQTAARPQR
ncbi:DNA cross-link repair 1A protein isoform X1 [Salarias fasciatus]|uniref:DNA cross-link repair 1A protein isoform X1 n=1 Tax=Salarias fasciatus TaxID=181472 RepID=UPI0011768CC6|nr:DNA cross-link repair 1A protein isoform X1 [Salarias fasciatus]